MYGPLSASWKNLEANRYPNILPTYRIAQNLATSFDAFNCFSDSVCDDYLFLAIVFYTNRASPIQFSKDAETWIWNRKIIIKNRGGVDTLEKKNEIPPSNAHKRMYDFLLYPANLRLSDITPQRGLIIQGDDLKLSKKVAFEGSNP